MDAKKDDGATSPTWRVCLLFPFLLSNPDLGLLSKGSSRESIQPNQSDQINQFNDAIISTGPTKTQGNESDLRSHALFTFDTLNNLLSMPENPLELLNNTRLVPPWLRLSNTAMNAVQPLVEGRFRLRLVLRLGRVGVWGCYGVRGCRIFESGRRLGWGGICFYGFVSTISRVSKSFSIYFFSISKCTFHQVEKRRDIS